MTPTEWIVFAIVVSGAAGVLVGYGIAWGKQRSRVDSHDTAIAQIERSFAECQKRGTECTASTRVLMETNVRLMHDLQADFAAHKASVHQHHEQQDIHTTSEWRRGVMERFDRIEQSVHDSLDAQTRTLIGRIENVERLVRNGGGK